MTISPTALRRNLLVLGLSIPLALLGCDAKDDTGYGGTTGGDTTGPGGGGPGGGGVPGGGGGPGATDDTGGGTGGGPGGGTSDSEYGPENTWWHAMVSDIPDGLSGTGRSVGDIANNFTLVDQLGDEVELYQFYGQVIVIDAFAEW